MKTLLIMCVQSVYYPYNTYEYIRYRGMEFFIIIVKRVNRGHVGVNFNRSLKQILRNILSRFQKRKVCLLRSNATSNIKNYYYNKKHQRVYCGILVSVVTKKSDIINDSTTKLLTESGQHEISNLEGETTDIREDASVKLVNAQFFSEWNSRRKLNELEERVSNMKCNQCELPSLCLVPSPDNVEQNIIIASNALYHFPRIALNASANSYLNTRSSENSNLSTRSNNLRLFETSNERRSFVSKQYDSYAEMDNIDVTQNSFDESASQKYVGDCQSDLPFLYSNIYKSILNLSRDWEKLHPLAKLKLENNTNYKETVQYKANLSFRVLFRGWSLFNQSIYGSHLRDLISLSLVRQFISFGKFLRTQSIIRTQSFFQTIYYNLHDDVNTHKSLHEGNMQISETKVLLI